jgi:uncharacterized SAM-binding protein YcdF (DUF218 family)
MPSGFAREKPEDEVSIISEAKVISRVRRKTDHKKIIIAILIIAVLQFIAVEYLIFSKGHSDPEVKTDYLIILGAGIKGEEISPALNERLNSGLQYLGKYTDTKVIVTGGQGRGEDISEAEAMKRFLVLKGIDEDRIIVEDKATSTMENFILSKEIISEKSGENETVITFVTNSFHVMRAKMLADRNGFDAHAISAKTPAAAVLKSYFREYFALIKSFAVDR